MITKAQVHHCHYVEMSMSCIEQNNGITRIKEEHFHPRYYPYYDYSHKYLTASGELVAVLQRNSLTEQESAQHTVITYS